MNMNSFEKNQEKLQEGDNFSHMKTKKKCPMFLDFFDGQVLFFQKWSSEMSSGFLRCNQCIKTLHLSYQTALSDDL